MIEGTRNHFEFLEEKFFSDPGNRRACRQKSGLLKSGTFFA